MVLQVSLHKALFETGGQALDSHDWTSCVWKISGKKAVNLQTPRVYKTIAIENVYKSSATTNVSTGGETVHIFSQEVRAKSWKSCQKLKDQKVRCPQTKS